MNAEERMGDVKGRKGEKEKRRYNEEEKKV